MVLFHVSVSDDLASGALVLSERPVLSDWPDIVLVPSSATIAEPSADKYRCSSRSERIRERKDVGNQPTDTCASADDKQLVSENVDDHAEGGSRERVTP